MTNLDSVLKNRDITLRTKACMVKAIVFPWSPTAVRAVKRELIGPGLHVRPVRADHARPPLQWTLNSLLSACGNNNGRIRPPPDRGTLKIISRLLIT